MIAITYTGIIKVHKKQTLVTVHTSACCVRLAPSGELIYSNLMLLTGPIWVMAAEPASLYYKAMTFYLLIKSY